MECRVVNRAVIRRARGRSCGDTDRTRSMIMSRACGLAGTGE
jgi:hypothetical protein